MIRTIALEERLVCPGFVDPKAINVTAECPADVGELRLGTSAEQRIWRRS